MPWFSCDPDKVKKDPKFHAFRKLFNWSPHQAFGFLCAFWGAVVGREENESGDISDWIPEFLAEMVGIGNVSPEELWEALVKCRYIEVRADGRVVVVDWVLIGGSYLKEKYHNDRQRLDNIWAVHGQIFGRTKRKEDRSDLDLNRSDSDLGEINAKNREISPPEIESLSSSLSTPLSSSHPEEDLKTYIPSRGSVAKAPLGFALTDPPEKPPAQVTILQKLFVQGLADLYEKPVEEIEATFNFGAAGKGFKKLLDHGCSVQTIANHFDPWFRSTDDFIVKNGHRITLFFTNYNSLDNGPIANQRGANGSAVFYDGAATVGTE